LFQSERIFYGLNAAGKEYSLQECGDRFRVTRERIRQIEEKALGKLRLPGNSGELRDYADFVSSSEWCSIPPGKSGTSARLPLIGEQY
jgi:hypothetical protein